VEGGVNRRAMVRRTAAGIKSPSKMVFQRNRGLARAVGARLPVGRMFGNVAGNRSSFAIYGEQN